LSSCLFCLPLPVPAPGTPPWLRSLLPLHQPSSQASNSRCIVAPNCCPTWDGVVFGATWKGKAGDAFHNLSCPTRQRPASSVPCLETRGKPKLNRRTDVLRSPKPQKMSFSILPTQILRIRFISNQCSRVSRCKTRERGTHRVGHGSALGRRPGQTKSGYFQALARQLTS
jgi:hypothetical protein